MFRNDYSETAAPEILEALMAVSSEQNTGYGLDRHSENAEVLIKDFFGVQNGKVHFIAGGTVTNMTVISFLLKPFEAVIACDTAHINVHETGAVEASGHKVITCPNNDGKIRADDIEKAFLLHGDEHMIKPKMVYISDATETGTVYTREELTEIRKICDKYGLYLFLDGARLGSALVCSSDVDAKFIGSICDVFYAGGTKNGLLLGEAVIFSNKELAEYFRYHIKNRGAMLAKGFVVGVQFERLFTDGLFLTLAKRAADKADIIRNGLNLEGIEFYGNSPTNQIFIKLKKEKAELLVEKFGCERWSDLGENEVIRIVTSFATTEDDCKELISYTESIL